MTTTYSIHEVAGEFDRLFPTDVDDATSGNGQPEAGYNGHGHEESDTVGWFCAGGNAGHPVMDIRREDVQRAGEVLAGMESAARLDDVEAAFAAAGIRYERRV